MTSSAVLRDIDVLTFDCYGTLIDWESGIWDALQPLFAAQAGAVPARQETLRAFAAFESEVESEAPTSRYPDVLARVHERIAAHFELQTTPDLDASFGDSVGSWPAFSDSAEALRYLESRYRLVILSNVHRAGFQASNERLGVDFDAVYTAEDVGDYKPSLKNFEYLLDRLKRDHDVTRDRILHVAQSLFHDHAPARSLGLNNAWIDRQRLSEGGDWGATAEMATRPETDFVFFSMAELADAVRAEWGDPPAR